MLAYALGATGAAGESGDGKGVNGFGRLIRSRRKAKRLSQTGLAKLVGVEQTYISRYERGVLAFPAKPLLEKFATALDLSMEELYRAGGYLEDIEAHGAGPRPDDPLDLVVRMIRDDPDIMAQLAEARREASPEVFEEALRELAGAWRANMRMQVATLRLGLGARNNRDTNGRTP